MSGTPSVATELAAHSRALRALAADLVGRSDADDLVQDTAVRALRSPPPVQRGLFAWLATVMRHLAANRVRGERRRAVREAARGTDGEGPPADADATHRDDVRAVVDALWNLPEPYQGTLVQRYFRDRSPAQIARATATPLATVKSRLQRGLDLLRAALARSSGRDWRLALVPAFALPAVPTWLVPLLSVTSMSTLAKSAAAVAAAALAAFAFWNWSPAAMPAPPAAVAGVAEAAAGAVAGRGEPEPGAAREQIAAVAAAPVPDLAQPFAFELRCRVVDADGLPVAGAHAAVAPPGCALALSPPTDADGRVSVTFRARVPALVLAVGYAYQGTHTSLQQVAMTAGEVAQVGFVAGLAPLPANVRIDALGRQIVTSPECSQGQRDCRTCHQGMVAANVFEVRGDWCRGLHPDAVFGDRLVTPPVVAEVAFDSNSWYVAGVGSGVSKPGEWGRIEGRVFGADGNPVGGVLVHGQQADFAAGVHSNGDGSFLLPWRRPATGVVELRAGGGPEGLASRSLELTGDHTAGIDLLLQTGSTLRGVVRGARSGGNGMRVEYVAAPGHDGDVATVGPDGRFAFANLAPGPGRLLLWGTAGEKLPIAEEPSVLPDGREVVFDLLRRGPANGGLRVCVRGHDGELTKDLEVRAWQVDTGRGAFLDRGEDGAMHMHGLVAGFYRVELGACGSGWRDLGQHWVDGQGLADLGTVPLAAPVTLRLEGGEAISGVEIYSCNGIVDLRAAELAAGQRELALPAGKWLVLWPRDGLLGWRQVDLVANTAASVRLDR